MKKIILTLALVMGLSMIVSAATITNFGNSGSSLTATGEFSSPICNSNWATQVEVRIKNPTTGVIVVINGPDWSATSQTTMSANIAVLLSAIPAGYSQIKITSPCTGETSPWTSMVSVLSVNASFIGCKRQGEVVSFRLVTETEINNKGFQIYSSSDGESWTEEIFVEGSGTTSERKIYTFEISSKKNLFKVVQLDHDGREELIRILTAPYRVMEFTIYSSSSTLVSFSSPEDTDMSVYICDLSGQIIYTNKVSVLRGVNKEQINLNLSNGIYICVVESSGKRATRKFTVNQ